MTQIDIYVFLLCLIVFSVLTLLSVVCVLCILKLKLKIINSGIEDEQIKTEYEKNKNKKRGVIDIITTSVLCVIVFVLMAFTVFSNVSNKISSNTVPSLFVVKSSSMEKKNPKNTYLTENNLNNQFAIHDLILTYKMPDQFDLKLYDIVVYEVDGILLIHRIVAIEEPNANHPNERYFLCQGDALESPDRFPVKYEQMRAIYKNQRLPFVGSIVSFLQSPAGWLCLLLLASSIIFTPVLEKKLQKAKLIRLRISLGNDLEQETKQTSTELEPNFIGFIENKNLTLQERIKLLSDKQKQNLELICNKLSTQSNLRKFEGKNYFTFKTANKPLAKITVKNDDIIVYLAFTPNASHIYQSAVYDAKHKLYPTKITVKKVSDANWVCQLINDVIKENSYEM